jgi:hypothetical protein
MLVLAACDPAPSTSTSETSGATPEDGTAGGDDSGSTPDPSAGTTGPTGTTADAGAPKKDGGAKDGGAEAGTSCSTCASELVASDPLNVALYGGAWYVAVDGTNVYIARNTATKIARVPKTGGTLVPYTIAATGDILALAEADDFSISSGTTRAAGTSTSSRRRAARRRRSSPRTRARSTGTTSR